VLAWCLERVEKPDEFLYHLEKPIPGRPVGDDVVEEELAAFNALLKGG
jgi:hypothetical protein